MVRRGSAGVVVAVFTLIATAVFASSAFAGAADAILKDASDGVIDGSYSAASVRASLRVVRSDPVYSQYSDIEGVLIAYLSGFGADAGSSGFGDSDGGGGTSSTEGSSGTSSPDATGQGSATTSKGGGTSGLHGSGSIGTDVSAAGLLVPRVPDGLTQARGRLEALPWFFVLVALGLLAGIVLLRRPPA